MKAFTLTTFDRVGNWSADLPLRLFLAWEFFESGLEKFNGNNWFADLQGSFPFPFNLLPAEPELAAVDVGGAWCCRCCLCWAWAPGWRHWA